MEVMTLVNPIKSLLRSILNKASLHTSTKGEKVKKYDVLIVIFDLEKGMILHSIR